MRRLLGFLIFLLVGPAFADPYFNSSETGCNPASPNPNYVLCDDFEDGSWYTTGNEPTNPANDGWYGCNDVGPNDSCRNPPPPAATCGSAGAVGTNCTATSSPQGGVGGDAALGMHGYFPNNATYTELWTRYYFRMQPGYVVNSSQKFISLIQSAYQGGIDFGSAHTRNLDSMEACPIWTCNFLNEGFLQQNMGNAITMTPGNWYFIEQRIRLNTYNQRNGIWQVWIDNCGSNGLGCTGTPTQRVNHTNVGWMGGGSPNGQLGSMWFDIWGNPADSGTLYIDQLIVSGAGPIGFMATSSSGSITVSQTAAAVTGIASKMNLGILTRTPFISVPVMAIFLLAVMVAKKRASRAR